MPFHFDLMDLRLIVCAADTGNLTRSADASHISLPAASARIRKMEDDVGAKLLYRNPPGVTLTPAGQALVHHARLMLAQMEHLHGDLQEYGKGVKGHLRLFANTTASSEFLPPVLRTYLGSHPGISIDFRELPSQDIVRAVVEGQTDIGIVAGPVHAGGPHNIGYRRDRLVVVVPADHPLAQRKEIDFASTIAFDHVNLHEASAIYAFLRRICDDMGAVLKVRLLVSNFETACRLIEAGAGIGIVPESAARRHAQTMKLALVELRDAWALRELVVCVRDLDALPSFARDMVELLMADARAADGPR